MARGRNELSSVERVVTEIKLLKEWKTPSELEKEMNSVYVTILRDLKELNNLGIVSKRVREIEGKGRSPVEYKLKIKETNLLFDMKTTIRAFSVLEELNTYKKGLTPHQLSENLNYPIAEIYKMLKFLVAIKWVKKEDPEFGPKKTKLYKPNYEIKLSGGY